METLIQILTILAPILLMVLTAFLIPQAKKLATASNNTLLEKLALYAASFAEAEAKKLESPSGKEKMELAYAWLKTQADAYKIRGSEELLKGLIETAVAQGTSVGWYPHVTKLSEDQFLKAFNSVVKSLETKAKAAGITVTPDVILNSLQSLQTMVNFEVKSNTEKTDGQ